MFIKKIEEKDIHVGENALVSLGRGRYEIRCIRGILWVTWPGSGDRILGAGDMLSVKPHGRICITSTAGALMRVKGKKSLLKARRDLPGQDFAASARAAAQHPRIGGIDNCIRPW